MRWRSLKFLALAAFLFVTQLPPAIAQNQSGTFADAFWGDAAMQMQFTRLWNLAFDRCKSLGQQRLEECAIQRSINAATHGPSMSLYCNGAKYGFARHDCIVMGSVAADLVSKFGIDSADGFIQAHGREGQYAVDAAGSAIWSYLDQKCSTSASPPDCQLEEVASRLQSSEREVVGCRSLPDPHAPVDCFIARWVAARVEEIAARV